MIGRALAIAGVGLTLGLIAAQAGLLEGPKARRARRKLGEAFRRIPLPHLELHLPTTRLEIDDLDDTLCECATNSGAGVGMTEREFFSLLPAVQKCTADLLFPDVDWPPVHSDHPSIHQYWAILEQRYRRLVLSGALAEFCGLGEISPPPEVDTVEPRSVRVGTSPLVRLTGSFSPDTTIDLRRGDGLHLEIEIQHQTPDSLELIVDADEPGSYELVLSNGPNPASSVIYSDALSVVQNEQE